MAGTIEGTWRNQVLPSVTPVVIIMNGAPLPCTVTLKSADAGRLIQLSTDGGVEYYTPTLTASSATMHVLAITYPVSHVRVTGAANDTCSVR